MTFVHLRSHSQLSFEDGLIEPSDLPKLAAQANQPAIALTDLHGMFGVVEFYTSARKAGVKPIIGADVWIDPDVTQDEEADPVRMNLICQDYQGYRRLMELVSRSHTENHRSGTPRIKQSWLREGTDGIIALSGDGTFGELAGVFASDKVEQRQKLADEVVAFYQEVFPGRYFLEVQRYAQPREDIQVAETVALSVRTGVPVVATHPIQFKDRQAYYAHEVRTCIASKDQVDDLTRETQFTREQGFLSTQEMSTLFADIPQALSNTVALAQRCSLEIPLGAAHLPHFQTPDGSTEEEYFATVAREGLARRLEVNFPDVQEREKVRPEYEARLEHEVRTINNMGFPGYFLIVSDFIGWAKDNGIPIGPGRGSGAGSLVAYSLRITNLDPIPNGLLFERFLNPDRVSMPDFDIDMDVFRRGEIVDYVRQKYGHEAVAQISTTGTSAAKASVRNVVRTMGLPFKVGDVVAKLIPNEVGISLDEALMKEPRLKEKYDTEPMVRKIVDVARMLEGTATSVGKHAAGVLIAPGKITDFTPLHLGKEGIVSQYNKDDVEAAGLVKFDFLGLAALNIVREAEDFINQRPEFKDKPFSIEDISLDLPEVYAEFAKGNTVGIFQFESSGMQGVLRRAVPDKFEDIVALNALYRPGPMDLIDLYVDRKHGRVPVEYPDPRVEEVLKETNGIMVYQEQVMQVAQILGGYSLGGADLLRRAMGKKKPEEMAKHRVIFAEGAATKGISEDKANELFDLIETFAGYGFNKSHAAAYSLIAYQTMYLKTLYPSEFYAASMNVAAKQNAKQSEIEKMIGDARAQGIKILPPDINDGQSFFSPVGKNSLRYGLSGLKGVKEGPVDAIVQAREEQGKFTSLFDFYAKVGRGSAGKIVSESLIRAGAFDSIHPNRAALIASVPDGLNYASKLAKQQAEKGSILPDDLFGAAPVKKKKKSADVIEPVLAEALPWSAREQLEQEKKAVGFYFSAHPFELYAKQLQGISGSVPLARIDEIDPDLEQTYLVAGLISEIKKFPDKNGNQMARLTIGDGQATRDVMLFSSTLEANAPLLQESAFIALEAKVTYDRRDRELPKGLILQDAWSFEGFEAYQARSVHVAMKRSDLPRLEELAAKHAATPGQVPIKAVAYVPVDDDRYHKIELNDLKLTNSAELLADIKDTFGHDKVKMGFARDIQFRPRAPRFSGGRRGHRP